MTQAISTSIDLERKMETALRERLKQCQALAGMRIRLNSEDSAKVNGDLVLEAKRGNGNPYASGIYDMEVTATLVMEHKKTPDTLPEFLAFCAALESVFSVPTYTLAKQLSACVPLFICYEIAVTAKDNTPVDGEHSCIWTLSTIATTAPAQ